MNDLRNLSVSAGRSSNDFALRNLSVYKYLEQKCYEESAGGRST